jgi:hypothetical protein
MPIQEPTRQTIREDDAGGVEGAGPLATLKTNKYQFSSFNYPIDIENLSHAMLFNIRVHEMSKDLGSREERAESNLQKGRRERLLQGSPNVKRKYVTVKRAISLYMPDTIVFDNKQNYEAPSLLEKLGIGGTAAITAGSDYLKSAGESIRGFAGIAAAIGVSEPTRRDIERAGNVMGSITPGAIIAGLSSLFKADRQKITPTVRIAAQLSGFAVNPVIEVLYSNPMLRAFNFDFIFAPRNEKEADMVWKIINEFRRHSAPEYLPDTFGTILTPPSEFQITFLRKSLSASGSGGGFIENTNIPRITSCVLSDVQVDYAPTGGYVTFEDGMPVQIRMRLVFIELHMITREMIDKGY